MLNILAFVETATIVSAVKIALAALALICTGFIVFIVMKQSGNSDGMEAMTVLPRTRTNRKPFTAKTPVLVRKRV